MVYEVLHTVVQSATHCYNNGVHDALCINSLFTFDMTQVYDRDLTTDDFMGSASVTLSDLEIDKWVPGWACGGNSEWV